MEQHHHAPELPLDCFTLDEVETFARFEGMLLADVNYYIWLNPAEQGAAQFRFLYFLELIFADGESLLLTSGEDSVAIRVGAAEQLIETAESLRQLHGQLTIRRLNAAGQTLWQPVIGKPLAGIRLSRNDAGLYQNDALLLDFSPFQIFVRLGQKEGLELSGTKEG